MTLLLALIFGVIVGLALGLTGGGGSVFAIPLLVFGLGIPMHEAVSLSLAAVTMVALTGSINAARSGLVEYRAGLIFAVAGVVMAPVGIFLADKMSEGALLTDFSLLVMVIAAAMWHKARRTPDETQIVRAQISGGLDVSDGAICKFNPDSRRLRLSAPCSLVLSATGLLSGLLSGLFGVGGGFIIVPALTFITQLSIHRAVATSLFVISLVGTSGLVSAILAERAIPWLVAAAFLPGGILGLVWGQRLAKRLAGPVLQKGFAISMVIVAIVTLWTRL